MKMEISMTPIRRKMTEAGKAIICHLCKEKPWRGKGELFRYKLPPELTAEYEEIGCLVNIHYERSEKIGMFKQTKSSTPILSLLQYGENVYLELVSQVCEQAFTRDLPKILSRYHAWDDIVSREPMEDEEDET